MPETHYPYRTDVDHLGKMTTRGQYRQGYPEGAIVHFTAGRSDGADAVEHAIKQKNDDEQYCYFVIATDGQVYQNFPLTHWGYHAGKTKLEDLTKWEDLKPNSKLGGGDPTVGVSQYLVGIEICNMGRLREVEGKPNILRPWWNDPDHYKKEKKPVPPNVPNLADDRLKNGQRTDGTPLFRHIPVQNDNQEPGWYHCYDQRQEAALIRLLKWLRKNSLIGNRRVFSYDLVLGHDEVRPGEKNDPGGALSMTMSELRAKLKSEST